MTVRRQTNSTADFSIRALGIAALLALAFPFFANAQDVGPTDLESEARDVVVLRALDKITARITELELKIGDEVRFGTLAIRAKYCRTRPPIEPPETFAYLEIDDLKRSGDAERVFEGWMVASSPALNALEHAVYDVWVINCKMVEPDSPGANS